MSDPGPSPKPDSLLARLKGLFTPERDPSLRESLEGVIANHDAQNPVDGLRAEAKLMMLNLIKFADLRVDDVMVPRADIVAIEDDANPSRNCSSASSTPIIRAFRSIARASMISPA